MDAAVGRQAIYLTLQGQANTPRRQNPKPLQSGCSGGVREQQRVSLTDTSGRNRVIGCLELHDHRDLGSTCGEPHDLARAVDHRIGQSHATAVLVEMHRIGKCHIAVRDLKNRIIRSQRGGMTVGSKTKMGYVECRGIPADLGFTIHAVLRHACSAQGSRHLRRPSQQTEPREHSNGVDMIKNGEIHFTINTLAQQTIPHR